MGPRQSTDAPLTQKTSNPLMLEDDEDDEDGEDGEDDEDDVFRISRRALSVFRSLRIPNSNYAIWNSRRTKGDYGTALHLYRNK